VVLYIGERPLFDYLLSLNVPVAFSNNLSGADSVIISEYSDQAVRTIKEALLVNIPVLGILDGAKSVIKAFDARFEDIDCAEGKQELAIIDTNVPIFEGLETVIKICRGKPFGVLETVMPKDLDVISRSSNGDILAVCNLIAPGKHGNVYGINYYLSSELTPDAKDIIKNFFKI
jgi:anthranilate/para-aminobenzoate synthase component II